MAAQTLPRGMTADKGKWGARGAGVGMLPGLSAPSSLLWPLPSMVLALCHSPQSSAPCPQGIGLSASALLGFALSCMTWCESLGLPPLSRDPLPPVPTPAASPNTQLLLQVPGRSAVYWRVREASPPSGWGLGRAGGFLLGVPQPSQKGQTAFWLPSVESPSEGPGRLWVSQSHLWAERIIKMFRQTLGAAFQAACCQVPS